MCVTDRIVSWNLRHILNQNKLSKSAKFDVNKTWKSEVLKITIMNKHHMTLKSFKEAKCHALDTF